MRALRQRPARRDFIFLFGGAAVAWPLAARAQQAALPVVGVVLLGSAASRRLWIDAFRDGLRRQGLIDGDNVRLLIRYADDEPGRLGDLARELGALGSRVLVTAGTTSVRALQTAVPGLPIVMAGSSDPVAMGFARSLARPGGNITGISILGEEIVGKRVELLKDLVPAARAFAAFLQASNPGNPVFHRALDAASRALGVPIHVREIGPPEDFPAAFAWAAALPADGVFLIEDPTFEMHREAIARMAIAHRLPAVAGNVGFAGAGALAVYSLDNLAIVRASGWYVAEILRGANPGDLPIQQPTTFRIVVNLRTARALGLTVPPTLLARADEVIE